MRKFLLFCCYELVPRLYDMSVSGSQLRMISPFEASKLHPSESPESSESLDPLARITVSLPRSLCRQFRLHALDQDTTLSALMARLIRKELRDSGYKS